MFMPGDFEHAAAHIVIGATDGVQHVTHRNAEGQQLIRVKVDLVLFDKAAHGGHLGHTLDALQPVADGPVL